MGRTGGDENLDRLPLPGRHRHLPRQQMLVSLRLSCCVLWSQRQRLHGDVCRAVPATALVCRHGGTPNLSDEPRSLPNVEYFAPWFRSEYIVPSMPYERWEGLSEHGQRISRFVVVPKGEAVIVRRHCLYL